MFRFSKRSLDKLSGVEPELILVLSRTLLYSDYDFSITCGLRTEDEQFELFNAGKSKTMNSKHLSGRAVDIAVYQDGAISWNFELYRRVADAFERASDELNIPTRWGGDFADFPDGCHFELM